MNHLDYLEAFELYVVIGLLDSLEKVDGQLSTALEVRVRHLRDIPVEVPRRRRVIARGGPRHDRAIHFVMMMFWSFLSKQHMRGFRTHGRRYYETGGFRYEPTAQTTTPAQVAGLNQKSDRRETTYLHSKAPHQHLHSGSRVVGLGCTTQGASQAIYGIPSSGILRVRETAGIDEISGVLPLSWQLLSCSCRCCYCCYPGVLGRFVRRATHKCELRPRHQLGRIKAAFTSWGDKLLGISVRK